MTPLRPARTYTRDEVDDLLAEAVERGRRLERRAMQTAHQQLIAARRERHALEVAHIIERAKAEALILGTDPQAGAHRAAVDR